MEDAHAARSSLDVPPWSGERAPEVPVPLPMGRSRREFPPIASLLYGALAGVANGRKCCRITHGQLGGLLGVSRHTIIKAQHVLVRNGLLRVEKDGSEHGNVYWLLGPVAGEQV